MSRQFFVGGNFKMNPCSIDQKKALIAVLNNAEIDPATGIPNAHALNPESLLN
jgi:triosephosphate isomerase